MHRTDRNHAAAAALAALVWVSAAGCSVVDVQRGPDLPREARWALLPVMNLAEAPQAGERVESMLSTILRARGIEGLSMYPAVSSDEALPELDERKRLEQALDWARGKKIEYALSGSVTEWRYKSGLDGEPAVGLALHVTELETGKIVWSASGARTGWGRESVSGTAQKLLQQLVESLGVR